MEVFAGPTIQVFVNVIVAGNHIDADTITGVLSTNPAVVPSVVRTGQGRYTLTFAGLEPELQAGASARVTISGTIGGTPWTPYDLALAVLPSENATGTEDGQPVTLAEMAQRPRVVQAGSERVEEHSLKDVIDAQRYADQKANQTTTPGRAGWPVLQWRAINERP